MGNSIPLTVCPIHQSIYDEIAKGTNPGIKQKILDNIKKGWIHIVVPTGMEYNFAEKLCDSMVLHLTDEAKKPFIVSVPANPGMYSFSLKK
jgi:hypothetical protein